MLLGLNFAVFSESLLMRKENCPDFDSAIPRFESWRPSNNFKGLGQKILAENESGKHWVSTSKRCANSGRRVNALCDLLVKD
jgi:hypothetical protein